MRAPTDFFADARGRALDKLAVLDTGAEAEFDELVALASRICDAPVSAVSLLDHHRERQWFKAETGLGVRETPLENAVCAHAVQDGDYLEIGDTAADARTADNAFLNSDPALRFYAGAVLKTSDGVPLGTLCVLDTRPRELTDLQRDALRVLAHQVVRQLELRAALARQEVLLREIDHRVKNSLMSVSSMVRLQAGRAKDQAVRDALSIVAQRVGTVAAIHEQLHQASDGDTVNLSSLFARAGSLFSEAAPDHVTIVTDFDPLTVSSSDAHSVAIIGNEFVANAIKHAFPEGHAGGTVRITGRRLVDGGYQVTCTDDGVGEAESLDAIKDSSGLGTRLMEAAVGSLRATAEWSLGAPGLVHTVTLPAP